MWGGLEQLDYVDFCEGLIVLRLDILARRIRIRIRIRIFLHQSHCRVHLR